MAALFLFSGSAKADGCSVLENSISGSAETLKKVWVKFDTFEKISRFDKKVDNQSEMSAFLYWQECFYHPWFNSWKSGRTKLSFEEALREGTEPMETCTSWKTCGPRPDWRTPKQKAAEEAVLKSRKK